MARLPEPSRSGFAVQCRAVPCHHQLKIRHAVSRLGRSVSVTAGLLAALETGNFADLLYDRGTAVGYKNYGP